MTLTIRPAIEQDLDFLASAEAEVFSDAWSREAVESALLSPIGACLIAENEDGTKVGYLLGSVIAPEGEILRVAALPSCRRQGVGRALVAFFADGSHFPGLKRLLLEVRSQNLPALSLYRSLGFIEDGRRKDYYKDPKDDAVLMSLPLG